MGRQRELLRLSIILCMGLLFVMAGILLIVGKLAGNVRRRVGLETRIGCYRSAVMWDG